MRSIKTAAGPLAAGSSVALAFSGGKDSTASARLLRDAGHRVTAVTMHLGLEGDEDRLRACSQLADLLGIPWLKIDCRESFQNKVLNYVLETYARGLTPNPCALCNRKLKFADFMFRALESTGCSYFATGHYAALRLGPEGIQLVEPLELKKSQIYFLAMVDPGLLNRVCFPLAEISLSEVRELVEGLPLANARESQDACFLAGGSMADFLLKMKPELFFPGCFLNSAGEEIGTHRGAARFTIGQRRGTNLAAGKRLYVTSIDLQTNSVRLGSREELFCRELKLTQVVSWKKPDPTCELLVKTRSSARPVPVILRGGAEGEMILSFLTPAFTVTPGQIGVLYQQGAIIAAGFISRDC